jgi:hypothetical protein
VVALRAAGDGTVVAIARESGDLEFYETEYWTIVQVNLAGRFWQLFIRMYLGKTLSNDPWSPI